ncbi:MAG TPA: ABC transporter permease [Firmicutes bacterium]|nr:ABC transporter permease [Bacillota bacterium]
MAEFWKAVLGNRAALLGIILVAAALLVALACQWLSPFDPNAQYRAYTGQPPGTLIDEDDAIVGEFRLGTDANGRDVLSRVLYGARISLLVGVVATALNLLIGILIGTLAGYFGGWLDAVLMRVTDTFFAFPGMLLAIILLATLNQPEVRSALVSVSGKLDPGIWGLFIALGLTGWTGIARVIRGQVLTLKEEEFVEAARAIGCGHTRIIAVHLVPNCFAPIIVLGTMQIAYNILSEAGLSFLGLGIQPPAASWGGMLSEGRPYLTSMPWWGVFPGLALALTVLGFNLFGDGLRDILDPRLKVRS